MIDLFAALRTFPKVRPTEGGYYVCFASPRQAGAMINAKIYLETIKQGKNWRRAKREARKAEREYLREGREAG